MRFIITARPGPDSPEPPDPNGPFDEALFSAYMKFNEEMHKAGVLVAAEGLKPDGNVARVAAKKGKRSVVDGPFTESKELVGGFYIIEVDSAGRSDRVGAALPDRPRLRRCPRDQGVDGGVGPPAESARPRTQGRADVERDVLEEAVRVEANPHGPWRRLECRQPPAGSRAMRDRQVRRRGTPNESGGA